MRPSQPGDDPALKLIHTAILSGTLIFFGVVYFLFSDQPTTASPVFEWVWLGIAILVVFVTGFVRGRLDPGAADSTVRTNGIVIWTLAEGAALVGMVSTIVTGDMKPAIGATLIAVFLLIHHRPSTLG